jgi:hypothetical protein
LGVSNDLKEGRAHQNEDEKSEHQGAGHGRTSGLLLHSIEHVT